MKRYLFITSAIFVMTVLTRAQTNVYHPFPDSNATWCCIHSGQEWGNCYDEYFTYTINGKEFINSQWYSRILTYDSTVHWQQCGPQNSNYTSYVSFDTLFIRQDIPVKKVWIYDPSFNTDKILYDFNLNVGDTLDSTKVYFARIPLYSYSQKAVITSIDSVLINGTYRKRFNYNWVSDFSMIEGIGALHGLLYPPSDVYNTNLLTAFKQDIMLLYSNPYGGGYCYNFPTSVAQNKNKLLSVNIFPNPVSDIVYFENLPYEKIKLKITNIFGQEVYCTQLKNTKTFSISFENYAPGIYFISIQSESGTSINKKIIKQ